MRVSSQCDEAPHDNTGLQERVTLAPAWRAFRLPFQIGLDGAPGHGEVVFDIGQRVNTIQIADLVLAPDPAPEAEWRRP